MSEKIKGVYGSETRANEVLKWLKSQGAEKCEYGGHSESSIYYIDKGEVRMVDKEHSVLFEIVELPRWRAAVGGRYYFINYIGKVVFDTDLRGSVDDSAYEIGNYFQTKEEAEKYTEKFCEFFKKIKGK